jgi:hypothetical protein
MTDYNLSHLTQSSRQDVWGPIQDDEALLLYAVIKIMRIQNVLEIGGLSGYSASNFLAAVGQAGKVFTCDINPVPKIADNHFFIHKNVLNLTAGDLMGEAIELLFFDCHEYDVQMQALDRLAAGNMLSDKLIIALHDTNTHPSKLADWSYLTSEGYVHQWVERKMVNELVRRGWHTLCLHPSPLKHNENFPFRHGLTIMSRFQELVT